MTNFNYRFSIIPAPAITDKDLSAHAFRVLALLGRHTNDAGWCSRSQVKMARELGIGRATVYDALEILFDRGYLERRANGRGGTAPEDATHPFSAYSYRVKLDRDDLPGRIKDAMGDDEGAAPAAGGAGEAAGGAVPAAPLEGISSEGISPEPERECARVREQMPVAKFLKRWPTAVVDDQTRITKAWQTLDADEQHAAMQGIDPFLLLLKGQNKTHIIAGWRYLEEKRWTLLEPSDKPADDAKADIACWSHEWWAALFGRISTGKPVGFMVRYALEHRQSSWTLDHPTQAEIDALTAYAANGPEIAAWRPWFVQRGIRFPEWQDSFSVFLPAPSPEGFDFQQSA